MGICALENVSWEIGTEDPVRIQDRQYKQLFLVMCMPFVLNFVLFIIWHFHAYFLLFYVEQHSHRVQFRVHICIEIVWHAVCFLGYFWKDMSHLSQKQLKIDTKHFCEFQDAIAGNWHDVKLMKFKCQKVHNFEAILVASISRIHHHFTHVLPVQPDSI